MVSDFDDYAWKAYDQRITKTPILANFTVYICSCSLQKSTPKFGLILNSSWSNGKLRDQNLMKIFKSVKKPQKANSTINPMIPNFLELDIDRGEIFV